MAAISSGNARGKNGGGYYTGRLILICNVLIWVQQNNNRGFRKKAMEISDYCIFNVVKGARRKGSYVEIMGHLRLRFQHELEQRWLKVKARMWPWR